MKPDKRKLIWLTAVLCSLTSGLAQWHEAAWQPTNWNSRAIFCQTNLFACSNWFTVTNWLTITNSVVSTQQFFSHIGPEDTTTQIFENAYEWAVKVREIAGGVTSLVDFVQYATNFSARTNYTFALDATATRDLDLHFATRERGLAVGVTNALLTRFYRDHYNNGLAVRRSLFTLVPYYVDQTKTGADGSFNAWFTNDELAAFPTWPNACTFCASNNLPTNLLDKTGGGDVGYEQIVFWRERPAISNIVSNAWAIAVTAASNTNTTPVTYTNTVFGTWGETNLLVGTNGQRFVTWSTNAAMLTNTTTWSYSAAAVRQAVTNLIWSAPINLGVWYETDKLWEHSTNGYLVSVMDNNYPHTSDYATLQAAVAATNLTTLTNWPYAYVYGFNNYTLAVGRHIGATAIGTNENAIGAGMAGQLLSPLPLTNAPIVLDAFVTRSALCAATAEVYFAVDKISAFTFEQEIPSGWYEERWDWWAGGELPNWSATEDTFDLFGVTATQSTNRIRQAAVLYTGTNWTWVTGTNRTDFTFPSAPDGTNQFKHRGAYYYNPAVLLKFNEGTGANAWLYK
jgi:hypothetical protein